MNKFNRWAFTAQVDKVQVRMVTPSPASIALGFAKRGVVLALKALALWLVAPMLIVGVHPDTTRAEAESYSPVIVVLFVAFVILVHAVQFSRHGIVRVEYRSEPAIGTASLVTAP